MKSKIVLVIFCVCLILLILSVTIHTDFLPEAIHLLLLGLITFSPFILPLFATIYFRLKTKEVPKQQELLSTNSFLSGGMSLIWLALFLASFIKTVLFPRNYNYEGYSSIAPGYVAWSISGFGTLVDFAIVIFALILFGVAVQTNISEYLKGKRDKVSLQTLQQSLFFFIGSVLPYLGLLFIAVMELLPTDSTTRWD